MKYKENETIEENNTESSIEKTSVDREDLYESIYKMINLRIQILENSLSDLKNSLSQLEDLYNERDDQGKLVAIQNGIYTNYVFKNLDEIENSELRYITVTKCPN